MTLFEMLFRGYTIKCFRSESRTVQIDAPRFGQKEYTIHVPGSIADGMESNATLLPFMTTTACAVMMLINERERVNDIG